MERRARRLGVPLAGVRGWRWVARQIMHSPASHVGGLAVS
jgi:hypothetical protein